MGSGKGSKKRVITVTDEASKDEVSEELTAEPQAVKKSSVKKSSVKELADKKPSAKDLTGKKSSAKDQAAKKLSAKDAKKPSEKDVTAKKPSAKKPSTKKTSAKKPSAKKPAAAEEQYYTARHLLEALRNLDDRYLDMPLVLIHGKSLQKPNLVQGLIPAPTPVRRSAVDSKKTSLLTLGLLTGSPAG